MFHGLIDSDVEAPEEDAYDLVIAIASDQADHHVAARCLTQWHQLDQRLAT